MDWILEKCQNAILKTAAIIVQTTHIDNVDIIRLLSGDICCLFSGTNLFIVWLCYEGVIISYSMADFSNLLEYLSSEYVKNSIEA